MPYVRAIRTNVYPSPNWTLLPVRTEDELLALNFNRDIAKEYIAQKLLEKGPSSFDTYFPGDPEPYTEDTVKVQRKRLIGWKTIHQYSLAELLLEAEATQTQQ